MKSKLAIAVTLSGWLLLLAYIYYDYIHYESMIFVHFFKPDHRYEIFFHIMVGLAPFISTSIGYLVDQRMKLLRSVKESEKKYRDLYQNAPDGYYSIDPDGIIINVNDTFLKMLGYEREEIIGKVKIKEFLSDGSLQSFNEDHRNLKEKGCIENLEYDFRKKDGSFLSVLVNATAEYDRDGRFLKNRSIVRDNRVKKDYQKMLIRAANEWRATFDAMPYGVMLLDNELNIIRTNKYISEISGFPMKELVGKKCYEAIHRTERPIEGCPMARIIENKWEERSEFYEPRLGIHFMINSMPVFNEDGSVIAYVNSLVDITDIKEKEKRLTESREAFLNMLRDTDHAYKELKDIHLNLIISFINALDAKSPWTSGHSERVRGNALHIAMAMGLSEKEIENLETAALLHDIGKIGTYDIILDKPDKLTEEEYALIKRHPAMGEEILSPIKGFKDILPIVRHHHERYDGRGYPDGLKGEEIPLLARILCIADSFDPMVSDRPYRLAPGIKWAIEEIKRCSGTHFDPRVAETFLSVLRTRDS